MRVKTSGAKSWVFYSYWNGRQEKLTFDKYPNIGLKRARQLRDQARETVALGIDLRQEQKAKRQTQQSKTFRQFIAGWLEFKLKKLNARPSKEGKHAGRQSTAVQIER